MIKIQVFHVLHPLNTQTINVTSLCLVGVEWAFGEPSVELDDAIESLSHLCLSATRARRRYELQATPLTRTFRDLPTATPKMFVFTPSAATSIRNCSEHEDQRSRPLNSLRSRGTSTQSPLTISLSRSIMIYLVNRLRRKAYICLPRRRFRLFFISLGL